jgi:hypothetical protein
VKVGDLVSLKCFPPIELGFGADPKSGLIVRTGEKHPHTWVVVLSGKEYVIQESGLEVINELSDEQLDLVKGGMSPRAFSNWRVEVLNEGR